MSQSSSPTGAIEPATTLLVPEKIDPMFVAAAAEFGKPSSPTSQPLAATPSRSIQPGTQLAIVPTPFTQAATACGNERTLLTDPQFRTSVFRFTSQPSAAVVFASANPALQTSVQVPVTHAHELFGAAAGCAPHGPVPVGLQRSDTLPSAAVITASALPEPHEMP